MKHSKASSRKDADSISSVFATHKSKASIKKNASQRKVHAALADGLEKTIKTNRKLKDEQITMPLSTLSEATLRWEEELDESEDKNKVYERSLWEGLYCEYLEEGEIVEDLASFGIQRLDVGRAILKTASELGVPSQAIKLWVHLYAARNGNEGHHRGIANLIARKDTRGVVRQFIDDKKSIYDLTPERLQGSISSVLLAIDKYRKELFRKCELRDYRVTKQGKKLG